ncbi:MAG TPA: methyltransferase domain-containing protein [bacterium]|nr:methyltransferase domain-containing protein [bacterium]
MIEKIKSIEINERGLKSKYYFHPWIYQNSCKKIPDDLEDGELLFITNNAKKIGIGFYEANSLYAIKILEYFEEFDEKNFDLEKIIRKKIEKAIEYREKIKCEKMFRIFYNESDGIPGLTIDKYENLIVIQDHIEGVYRIRNIIEKIIKEKYSECFFYIISPRKKREWLGEKKCELPYQINYNGINFLINLESGHKTGFYLDQLNNIKYLSQFIRSGDLVLDAFAYTGTFALFALNQGAYVDVIEFQQKNIDLFKKICELNSFKNYNCYIGRFEKIILKLEKKYDFIFLDPPALVFNKNQKKKALQYLHKIILQALNNLKINSRIAINVCSYALTDNELKKTILSAACSNKSILRLIYENRAALDHPVLLNFLEGDYLRCLCFEKIS